MRQSDAPVEGQDRPSSPCTKVCRLDAAGYCSGCLRTGAEIGAWISMTAAQQWQLIAELERRRRARVINQPEVET
ncbi:MAG TPA: DUF1289 domain-containing protein [Steroidobacteraceae bacterium]|nr:DUF1289 domain-containing protein [Steroidobacteraceae bacterium]